MGLAENSDVRLDWIVNMMRSVAQNSGTGVSCRRPQPLRRSTGAEAIAPRPRCFHIMCSAPPSSTSNKAGASSSKFGEGVAAAAMAAWWLALYWAQLLPEQWDSTEGLRGRGASPLLLLPSTWRPMACSATPLLLSPEPDFQQGGISRHHCCPFPLPTIPPPLPQLTIVLGTQPPARGGQPLLLTPTPSRRRTKCLMRCSLPSSKCG